jgi:hypothetical protein
LGDLGLGDLAGGFSEIYTVGAVMGVAALGMIILFLGIE